MPYVKKTHQVRGDYYLAGGLYDEQLLFSGSLDDCERFVRELGDIHEWVDVHIVDRKKKTA